VVFWSGSDSVVFWSGSDIVVFFVFHFIMLMFIVVSIQDLGVHILSYNAIEKYSAFSLGTSNICTAVNCSNQHCNL
jgi:hypothetical protein